MLVEPLGSAEPRLKITGMQFREIIVALVILFAGCMDKSHIEVMVLCLETK